jgi:putative transposase
MAHSFSNVLVHLVFATWHRTPWLAAGVEPDLHQYLSTVARANGCPALSIGSADDHIHVLCRLARTMTVAKLVELLKSDSSQWMKTALPELHCFAWQLGYGAFSVGRTEVDRVRRYLERQRSHHRDFTYQQEFAILLERHELARERRPAAPPTGGAR